MSYNNSIKNSNNNMLRIIRHESVPSKSTCLYHTESISSMDLKDLITINDVEEDTVFLDLYKLVNTKSVPTLTKSYDGLLFHQMKPPFSLIAWTT